MSGGEWALVAAASAVGLVVLVAVVAVSVPIFRAVGSAIRRIGAFVAGEAVDIVRLIASIIAGAIFAIAMLINGVMGRMPSFEHYLAALQNEAERLMGAAYRIFIGHPARLLSLTPLTEALEQHVPSVLATSPGATSSAKAGRFEGYTIVGTLPAGGSGAKLFIAVPTPEKHRELVRVSPERSVEKVVIKSFGLGEGSTLPQIVRESRALAAASRMGLVLDHAMGESEFHYVTRYEAGESLTVAIKRLHDVSGEAGLSDKMLREGLGYVCNLLETLSDYHGEELWHKDVKPDNIIISSGRATLVDLGLVTPMHSGLTLTTHGTEYFRDPEMVRFALKGAKVQDVDGARFDVYSAGAVLFAIVENTFPGHGGLSRVTKQCPDAVKWIIARAMAEYGKRYASAAEMLADVQCVLAAADVRSASPGDLPSVQGAEHPSVDVEFAELGGVPNAVAEPNGETASHGDESPSVAGSSKSLETVKQQLMDAVAGDSAAQQPSRAAANNDAEPEATKPASPRRLILQNWWTGRYRVDE